MGGSRRILNRPETSVMRAHWEILPPYQSSAGPECQGAQSPYTPKFRLESSSSIITSCSLSYSALCHVLLSDEEEYVNHTHHTKSSTGSDRRVLSTELATFGATSAFEPTSNCNTSGVTSPQLQRPRDSPRASSYCAPHGISKRSNSPWIRGE